MERTEIRAEYLGAIEDPVEVFFTNFGLDCPGSESFVGPEDLVVGVQHHDAVRHSVENALVLEDTSKSHRFAMVVRDNAKRYERLVFELSQCIDGVVDRRQIKQ